MRVRGAPSGSERPRVERGAGLPYGFSVIRLPLVVVVPLLVAASASTAAAEARPYRGPHPVDLEGNWHEEESVHVHDDLPVGLAPFAAVDGVLVFLADPLAYGWDAAVWTYDGVHPLPARIGEYCGIEEEHRHPFAPEGRFREEHGVHRYVGALRGGVPQHRPGRMEPESGHVPRPTDDGQPSVLYHHLPVCGVVTERTGDTTTTFVTGWPGCVRHVPPVRRRAPSVHHGTPHRRHHHHDHARRRDRRHGGTEDGRGTEMRTEPSRPDPPRRRAAPPAARRGR